MSETPKPEISKGQQTKEFVAKVVEKARKGFEHRFSILAGKEESKGTKVGTDTTAERLRETIQDIGKQEKVDTTDLSSALKTDVVIDRIREALKPPEAGLKADKEGKTEDDLTWYLHQVDTIVADAQKEDTIEGVRDGAAKNALRMKFALTGKERDRRARDIPKDEVGRVKAEAIHIFMGLYELNEALRVRRNQVQNLITAEETRGDLVDKAFLTQLKDRETNILLIEEVVVPLINFQEVTQRKIQERALEMKKSGEQGQILPTSDVFGAQTRFGPKLFDFRVGCLTVKNGELVEVERNIREIAGLNRGRRGLGRPYERGDATPIILKATQRPIELWKLIRDYTGNSEYLKTGMLLLLGREDAEIDGYDEFPVTEGLKKLAKRTSHLVRDYTLKENISLADIADQKELGADTVLMIAASQAISEYTMAMMEYMFRKENAFPHGYAETLLKEDLRTTNEADRELIEEARHNNRKELEQYLKDFAEKWGETRQIIEARDQFKTELQARLQKEGEIQGREGFLQRMGVLGQEVNLEAIYEAVTELHGLKEIFDKATVEDLDTLIKSEKRSEHILRHIGVLLHNVPGVAEFVQLAEIQAKHQLYSWLTGVTEIKENGELVKTKKGVIEDVQEAVTELRTAREQYVANEGELKRLKDQILTDPTARQEEENLGKIQKALAYLVGGVRSTELSKVLDVPTRKLVELRKGLSAVDRQILPFVEGRRAPRDNQELATLSSTRAGILKEIENVQEKQRLVMSQTDYIEAIDAPELSALLIQLSATKLSADQEAFVRRAYREVTGNTANPARPIDQLAQQIGNELVTRRSDILAARETRRLSTPELNRLATLEAEQRGLQRTLNTRSVSGKVVKNSQEYYALEFLEQLTEQRDKLEKLLLPSKDARDITVQAIKDGKITDKTVRVEAGESYYGSKRKELERNIKSHELDIGQRMFAEQLAYTIRVVTGMDAAGNKVHPVFEKGSYLMPEDKQLDTVDLSFIDPDTGEEIKERVFVKSKDGGWITTGAPNRVLRLTLGTNFRNTLLLDTVRPTHYDMVVNTKFCDMKIGHLFQDVDTPHIPRLWEKFGVKKGQIADIDFANISLADIPFDYYRDPAFQASYGEWTRYVKSANSVRSDIQELLNKDAITLDDVKKLELATKFSWLLRTNEYDQKSEYEDFYLGLSTEYEVYSSDNRVGWYHIRAYNDKILTWVLNRIKMGALADRFRGIYMDAVGAKFSLAALGGKEGARQFTPAQKARQVLHLGYAIDAKKLLQIEIDSETGKPKEANAAVKEKPNLFGRLKRRFDLYHSLNGEILQDWLDNKYYFRDRNSGSRQTQTRRGYDASSNSIKDREVPNRVTVLDLLVLGGLKVIPKSVGEQAWILPANNLDNDIVWIGKLVYDKAVGTLESPIYKIFLQKLAKERGLDFAKYETGDAFTVGLLNDFAREHLRGIEGILTIGDTKNSPFPFAFNSYSAFHTFFNQMIQDSSWVDLFNSDNTYRDFRVFGAIREAMEFGITKDEHEKNTYLDGVKIVSDDGDPAASYFHGNGFQTVYEFSPHKMEIIRTPYVPVGVIPHRLEYFALEEDMYNSFTWHREGKGEVNDPTIYDLTPENRVEYWKYIMQNMWVGGEWAEHFMNKLVKVGEIKIPHQVPILGGKNFPGMRGETAGKAFWLWRNFWGQHISHEEQQAVVGLQEKTKIWGKVIPVIGGLLDTFVPILPTASTLLYYGGTLTLAAVSAAATGGFMFAPEIIFPSLLRMWVTKPFYSLLLPKALKDKGMRDISTYSEKIRPRGIKFAVGTGIGALISVPPAVMFASGIAAIGTVTIGTLAISAATFAVPVGLGIMVAGGIPGGLLTALDQQKRFYINVPKIDPKDVAKNALDRMMAQFGQI